jgi:excisionase family DNA binding protein
MRRVRYKQAAEHTGIPEGTLRALVCRKSIPHIRVSPRLVLLDLDELDQWLAAKTVQP